MIIEKSKNLDADRIARLLAPVLKQHHVDQALLFGSFATGRQSRKSDIDLILIRRDSPRRYFDRFEGILEDLYNAVKGRDIEVFIYTPEELEKIRHRSFIRRALSEAKVIYDSSSESTAIRK